MIRASLALLLLLFCTGWAHAHEVRPAYLSITQTGPDTHSIVWKQPLNQGRRLRLTPVLEGCETSERLDPTQSRQTLGDSLTLTYDMSCSAPLSTLTLEGLDRTLTDVFVRVTRLDGSVVSAVLKPDGRVLDLRTASPSPARDYLWIGFEHIIFGWDHLLLVIGFIVLVPQPRRLLGVSAAFTLAHSVTLVLSVQGQISLAQRPVEILIAASLVVLAVEVLRTLRGESSFLIRRPYVAAGLIGLVHGLGFAGALSDIGLPEGARILALVLFNIGVELGQIAIIIGLGFIIWVTRPVTAAPIRSRVIIAFAYSLGTIGMYAAITRTAPYLSLI
jgi:hypothetical protein